MDAALSLHGLDDDAPGVGADSRRKCLRVVEWDEGHVGEQWLEAGSLRGLARHGERAERPAVERAVHGDDAGSARGLAGELEGRLDALRPGVAEEGLRAAEAIGEESREHGHRFRPVEVGRVPEPFKLLGRGGDRCRMAVTEADDRNAGQEIEILAAGVADEPGSPRRTRT